MFILTSDPSTIQRASAYAERLARKGARTTGMTYNPSEDPGWRSSTTTVYTTSARTVVITLISAPRINTAHVWTTEVIA